MCMGSGRLAMELGKTKGWSMSGVEREVSRPEYDDEYLIDPRKCSDREGKIHLWICSLRDVRPQDLATVDFIHFSLNCQSVSNAAGGKHGRVEANEFFGTTEAANEYNQDLMHAIRICQDQLDRRDATGNKINEHFKFIFEAPQGVSKSVPYYKYIVEQPLERGGLGGTRLVFDMCKFGVEYQKRTFLWTNVRTLINKLANDGVTDRKNHEFLCGSDAFGCQHYRRLGASAHANICHGVRTEDATPFPDHLCVFLATCIDNECAFRRSE